MSEDLSDVLNNLKNMMNHGEINVPNNVKDMLGNLSSNNSNSSTNTLDSTEQNNNLNIDFETILKMKTIIDSMNKKDDPRANLLYSLKPYLRESRKKQLDQYVNLLNMTKIADIMRNDKGEQR